MDDLLIVRRSNRVKERFARTPSHAPVGMNLGIVLGIALGFGIARAFDISPLNGIIVGAAFGFALGGPFGRFFKSPTRSYQRIDRNYSYDGLPFESEEEEDESEPEESSSTAS